MRMAGLAVTMMLLGAFRAGGVPPAQDTDVIIASGTLGGQALAGPLFHIGEFWMRVPENTEFHRWLSQGMDRKAVILLTTSPEEFADEKNVRILSGTLVDETVPNPPPPVPTEGGRLPEGNMAVLHILFLKDELSGSLGAVTFQTSDLATVTKFDPHDGAHINIVIKID